MEVAKWFCLGLSIFFIEIHKKMETRIGIWLLAREGYVVGE